MILISFQGCGYPPKVNCHNFLKIYGANGTNFTCYVARTNPELVIVYGDHRRNYLECYTMEAIEEVDAKIDRMPRGSMQRKALQRLFHGQSFPTTVDETGRLVLPAKLRNKIELNGEAFFIAAGDTFQIWKPETYETEEEAWQQELPDDVDPLSFLDGDMEI